MPIEDLVNPRALDYHAETGHIYFADTTSFLIGRQKTDGSGRETILSEGDRCSLLYSIFFIFFFCNSLNYAGQSAKMKLEILRALVVKAGKL